MAQRRMLYASLWQNEDFAKLSDKAKLLYIGTITLADDYGRVKANSHILKSQVFPFDEKLSVEQLKGLLAEIVNQKMIKYYQVDGAWYLEHPKWFDWQILRKDRMSPSRIPEPTECQPNDNQLVTKRPLKISKDKIREVKTIDASKDAFGEFERVRLSKEEFIKLVERIGEKNTRLLIAELDTYIASKNKKYASHYATILGWARRRLIEHNDKLKTKKVGSV